MFNYAEMTTAELIDLLFTEEDRVTLEHIQEIVRRGDEAKPRLREILLDEDYWYEGQYGDFWIELHTVTILALMRDEKLLPDLLSAIMTSYFANQEWVTDRWTEILAQFGESAVEPLINYILELRGAFRDNSDYGLARVKAAEALTRIALEHAGARERARDFLLRVFTDPEEDDYVFLSYSQLCPVALDRQRGLEAVRAGRRRKMIVNSAFGDYNEFARYVTYQRSEALRDFNHDLLDFYQPRAIAARQERWAKEKDAKEHREDEKKRRQTEEDRAVNGPPPFPLPMELMYTKPGSAAPTGYFGTEAGNLVRAEKIGRNDPCPCGSGKKYKKCCGR